MTAVCGHGDFCVRMPGHRGAHTARPSACTMDWDRQRTASVEQQIEAAVTLLMLDFETPPLGGPARRRGGVMTVSKVLLVFVAGFLLGGALGALLAAMGVSEPIRIVAVCFAGGILGWNWRLWLP